MTSSGANPAQNLSQELDAARQLTDLLKREQQQLIEAEIENLSAIVQEKAVLIARLSELAAARMDTLTQLGYDANEASMQKWFDSLSSSGINRAAAKKSWDDLLTLVSAAKEINRTNGLLIGTHMSRNQATLQVLQGNQSGQVYGPDGQASMQASRRNLIIG